MGFQCTTFPSSMRFFSKVRYDFFLVKLTEAKLREPCGCFKQTKMAPASDLYSANLHRIVYQFPVKSAACLRKNATPTGNCKFRPARCHVSCVRRHAVSRIYSTCFFSRNWCVLCDFGMWAAWRTIVRVLDRSHRHGKRGNSTGRRQAAKNVFGLSVELDEPLVECKAAAAESGNVTLNRRCLPLHTFVWLSFCCG